MARTIAIYQGTELTGKLMQAIDSQSIAYVQSRLLDGTYNIQTIGEPSTEINVIFLCENDVRRQLEACAVSGTPLTITFDGDSWNGLIKDAVVPNEIAPPKKFKLNFVLLADEGLL